MWALYNICGGINIETQEELLKYAVENGMIDLTYVQDTIQMNKRKEYLEKHPYKIWEGKDHKWRTYLTNGDSRKMVKRNTEKELQDVIINYYKDYYKGIEEKELPVTFDDMYYRWRSVQDELVSDNTIAKYNTDYKRYFEGTEFSKKSIINITEEDVKVFICQTVKRLGLCKRSCKSLFGYVKNVLRSAMVNRIIKDDPMQFLEPKQFYKYCTETVRKMDRCVVSDSEMSKLYEIFQWDYQNRQAYMPTYAVEFATLTGMRVGEISALSWDCITDSYIIVNKSEKYNKITKEFFIDKTKNKKDRIFPITKEIRNLLDRVKKAELQNGYICDWVFANENGRIHAPVITCCSRTKCRQAGISDKGIHAYRRTVNSKMRCEGVSATIAAALLGHTEEVNEHYYTFDISGIEEKAKIISRINSEMPIAK